MLKVTKQTILLAILLLPLSLSAQSAGLSGLVTDSDGEALPFVNVVLLSLPDSNIVVGSVTDNQGRYFLQTNRDGGLLKVSCVGYQTRYEQAADGLTIRLSMAAQLLGEVVVKGQLPQTRLTGNSIITTIQGSVLEHSGTVQEMLVMVPGMTGSEEGLEVLGKGTPIVYINGRLMRDDSELQRLRSDDIRDVEVINNPGAQYDATVRAVVRIRTRKHQGDGLSVDLNINDDQDLRYGFNTPRGKLGLNYRKNGVDLFGSVYYSHLDYRQYSSLEEIANTTKEFLQAGPYTMTWENDQLVYTAGANWQIADHHSVGVRADVTHYLGGTNTVLYNEDIFVDGIFLDHLFSQQTSQESKPLGLLTNAYYSGVVGQLGIDFNLDFLNTAVNTVRENVEQSLIADDFVRSSSGTESQLYAAKLVLSYPLWGGTIDAGSELALARRHNTYWIDKIAIANSDADIIEDNIAAFAEYARDFGRWGQASAGVRYEHTRFDYRDDMNLDYLNRSQNEFFPTASYAVDLGKVKMGLSYGFKTNRPSFFAMNDAVTYISRYSMQAGNSQLLNERLQDMTLNATYKWLTFSASYGHLKNAITQWAYLTSGDAALIKHINLDKPINTIGAYVSATPRAGFWSMNATAGVAKQDLWLDLEDTHVPAGTRRAYFDKPVFTLNAFNTFSLKHDWRVDVNFMFYSRGHQLNFYNDCDNIRLGASVQKSLLKDKSLTLRLAVTDILQRNRMNEVGDMGYYQIRQENRYSTHKLQFSLVYRLNPARSHYKGTGAGVDAQARMK